MAPTKPITPLPFSELQALVESQSGQHISNCYQCGKCTAGCPSAYAMNLGPRQIMRAIQLGLRDDILGSSTIWVCLSCQTCSARCPKEIDIAKVMESLRLLAVAENTEPAEKDVRLFHHIFLSLIKRQGRIYELGLGALYNLRSRHLLSSVSLLPQMLFKGKLSILPPRTKGASEVKAIFTRVHKEKNMPPGRGS